MPNGIELPAQEALMDSEGTARCSTFHTAFTGGLTERSSAFLRIPVPNPIRKEQVNSRCDQQL